MSLMHFIMSALPLLMFNCRRLSGPSYHNADDAAAAAAAATAAAIAAAAPMSLDDNAMEEGKANAAHHHTLRFYYYLFPSKEYRVYRHVCQPLISIFAAG
jgi:hypothetical protein